MYHGVVVHEYYLRIVRRHDEYYVVDVESGERCYLKYTDARIICHLGYNFFRAILPRTSPYRRKRI